MRNRVIVVLDTITMEATVEATRTEEKVIDAMGGASVVMSALVEARATSKLPAPEVRRIARRRGSTGFSRVS